MTIMNPYPPHPLVSAIIPAYNRAWSLARAIESVLTQTFTSIEIIVVDDGSTDDTVAILAPYLERITLIRQENRGVSAARNLGIRTCHGDFVAFLDSDDQWLPEKTSRQIEFFSTNPEAMICQTEEIWIRRGKRVNPGNRHRKPSGMIFEPSLHLCLVSPSAVMMRRGVFDRVGWFDEAMPACEDYDLWLRASLTLPIFLVDRPCVVKHGGHEDQLSSQHSLDRYRIHSLEKLLRDTTLSPGQRQAVEQVHREKCAIYGQGCLKRGKTDEGNRFLSLALENRSPRETPEPVSHLKHKPPEA